jgi:hypothetical protein
MTINTLKINTNIINNGNLERKLLRILLGVLAFSATLYMIFLAKTVFSIVERKNIESEIRTVSANIGQLEIDYLARSNNVDMRLASSLGFAESKDVHFATRRSLAFKYKGHGNEL